MAGQNHRQNTYYVLLRDRCCTKSLTRTQKSVSGMVEHKYYKPVLCSKPSGGLQQCEACLLHIVKDIEVVYAKK